MLVSAVIPNGWVAQAAAFESAALNLIRVEARDKKPRTSKAEVRATRIGNGRNTMNRKFAVGLLLAASMLLVGVGNYRSQEPPEPPEPPDAANYDDLESRLLTADGAAWLGVTLKDVTAEKARDLKLPGEYGVLVESVEADSAAAKAGLEKGDVIVEFAGERVRSEAQLRRLIRETPVGRTVSLQVIRDGQARTLSAKLQSRTNAWHAQLPEIHIPEIHVFPNYTEPFSHFNLLFGNRPSLGISGDELTTQLANYFGVKQGKGVLVREVVVGSAGEKAGLKAGDVIVAVDGKSVATVAELRQALEIKPGEEKRKLNLTVVRDHQERTVPVELERPGAGERERAARDFGIEAGQWERIQAELKAQLAASQRALQEAQKQLVERQHLISDRMQQAAEAYRRAVQQQLKLQLNNQLKLQLQKQLQRLPGQSQLI
jgi:membrane-associated protease RseP (regulator of RpoE activity)